MKNCLITLTGMSILFLAACSKDVSSNEMPNETPTIHDSIEIDIDEDGIEDYTIQFDQPFFSGPNEDTMTGLVGRFVRHGENEILQNKQGLNLFLRNLDEIEENVAEPLFWSNLSSVVEIVSITTNTQGEWPDRWEINSSIEYSTYFIGLKLVTNNVSQIAWIEIDISTSDGSVSIVDKGLL